MLARSNANGGGRPAVSDALTALDRAIQRIPEAPAPPPPYDDHQITPINEAWNILADGPAAAGRSLSGRLRSFVWGIVGPPLERQRHFNAALVDHLNRNVAAHRERGRTLAAVIERLTRHIEGAVLFQQHLILYLQTVTLYIDTKDRIAGGQARALNAVMSGLTDDWLKRWESSTLREQRYESMNEARHAASTAAVSELKEVAGRPPRSRWRDVSACRGRTRRMASRQSGMRQWPCPGQRTRRVDLPGFADRLRGSREDIRARLLDTCRCSRGDRR